MKKWIIVAIPMLILTILLFAIPWSPLNCWHEKIDIMAGRYKYERYLLLIKFIDREEETELSMLYRKLIGEPPPPVWHTVNTFSPGVHYSPHYVYHGALSASYSLIEAYKTADFSERAKKETLINLLELLQEDGNYHRASKYSRDLLGLACEKKWLPDKTIDLKDLPAIPEKGE